MCFGKEGTLRGLGDKTALPVCGPTGSTRRFDLGHNVSQNGCGPGHIVHPQKQKQRRSMWVYTENAAKRGSGRMEILLQLHFLRQIQSMRFSSGGRGGNF